MVSALERNSTRYHIFKSNLVGNGNVPITYT